MLAKVKNYSLRRSRLLLPILFAVFLAGGLRAQETGEGAFLYRGHLNESNIPSTGLYDFSFRLAEALENGDYLGSPLTNSAVSVTNGQFSVRLDFGTMFFDGSPRWLEVGVRT